MEKALSSGSDALILDLEDSVGSTAKPLARAAVRRFLDAIGPDRPQIWVRINAMDSGLEDHDLAAVIAGRPAGLVLPKATPENMRRLATLLSGHEAEAGAPSGSVGILPIATETPAGVFQLRDYPADPRLAGLTWGAEDLSAALGALAARDEAGRLTPVYELARALTLLAAGAAAVPAIETVYPDFRDLEGLAGYVARGRRDGFVGMMAIHPSQVPVINAGFVPTPGELAHARAVVAAFETQGNAGVVAMDQKMLDAPHLAQARRLLERSQRPGSSHSGGLS